MLWEAESHAWTQEVLLALQEEIHSVQLMILQTSLGKREHTAADLTFWI